MAFPESFLQELAEKNDIADVVSGYVRLTKRSGQNLFGLCPFHSEKTPSFSVNSAKQIYHCFGCGKGGSVINFVMEVENLSFPEAVEFLARRAGIPVPQEDKDPQRPKRERMLAMNREAARYFHEQLSAPDAQRARAYVEKRGIGTAAVTNFGLGYAPDSWDGLTSRLKQLGYSERELFEAGLVRQGRKGGVYDTFRDRLMFPVIDVRGGVVAFSGRALGDGEPKYMNSPETPVFSKSHNLFGLNLAKKSKRGYIILVEGNVDVVSLHQAGFDSAVASLGTSLTPEQARLISRFTNSVIIAYDADEAGKKAAQRAIGLLEKLELKVRVLTIPGAKDPDEYIRAKGADAFEALLAGSEDQVDYRLALITGRYDLNAEADKVSCLREGTELIAALPGSVEREVYGRKLAELCGVSYDAVRDETARRRKRRLAAAKKDESQKLQRPATLLQPAARELRYENVRSAAAEEGVIRLLWTDPALFRGRDGPAEGDFSSPALLKIYRELRSRADAGGELSMAGLSGALSPEETALLTGLLQEPVSTANAARALGDYIEIMKAENTARGDTADDILALQKKLQTKKGYKDNEQ